MRAVLFEGTPEEFARVEATFRAGGDPSLPTRSIVLPQRRPRTWPELGEEDCHRLAKRVLEILPERVCDALGYLAELQVFHGEQTIGAWAEYAGRPPDELCGYLAELGRCAGRAFIELFGCDHAPQRVKGAAAMLLQKIPSPGGAYVVLRPGLMRAMAERGLLDPLPSALEERGDAETDTGAGAAPTTSSPAPPPPAAVSPSLAAPLPPPRRPLAVARPKPPSPPQATGPGKPPPAGATGGVLGEIARLLMPLTDTTRSGAAVTPAAATGNPPPTPAAKRARNPFSLLDWADADT